MLRPDHAQTGIAELDQMLGGLMRGDNVLLYDDADSLAQTFTRPYLTSSRLSGKEVIYVTFDRSPSTELEQHPLLADSERCVIVDCFTWGKGSGAEVFTSFYRGRALGVRTTIVKVTEPHKMPKVVNAVFAAQAERTQDLRIVVDSLSGAAKLWGSEETMLSFYDAVCPRISEVGSIAYWLVDRRAHERRIYAQVDRIAQVIIELTLRRGVRALTIVKADQRAPEALGQQRVFHVRDHVVSFDATGATPTSGLDIGRRIREMRQAARLSQAELAKSVGVTASTISQVESNQISPSLAALARMIEVLGSDLGRFFHDVAGLTRAVVHPAADAVEIPVPTTPAGARAFSLLSASSVGRADAHLVELEAGARIEGHFTRDKGEELVYVLAGVVEVKVDGRKHVARAGDVVQLTTELPECWQVLGEGGARLLAVLVK